jgi:hypothetical protein
MKLDFAIRRASSRVKESDQQIASPVSSNGLTYGKPINARKCAVQEAAFSKFIF